MSRLGDPEHGLKGHKDLSRTAENRAVPSIHGHGRRDKCLTKDAPRLDGMYAEA